MFRFTHTNDCLSSSVPGSGLLAGVVAGVSVALLLVCVAAAVGVIYYRRRSSRNGKYHLQTL